MSRDNFQSSIDRLINAINNLNQSRQGQQQGQNAERVAGGLHLGAHAFSSIVPVLGRFASEITRVTFLFSRLRNLLGTTGPSQAQLTQAGNISQRAQDLYRSQIDRLSQIRGQRGQALANAQSLFARQQRQDRQSVRLQRAFVSFDAQYRAMQRQHWAAGPQSPWAPHLRALNQRRQLARRRLRQSLTRSRQFGQQGRQQQQRAAGFGAQYNAQTARVTQAGQVAARAAQANRTLRASAATAAAANSWRAVAASAGGAAIAFTAVIGVATLLTKAFAELITRTREAAERINERNRALEPFSGLMMQSFFRLSVNQYRRNVVTAGMTEDSASKLTDSIDRMRDAWLKFDISYRNFENNLGRTFANFSTGFARGFGNPMESVNTIMDAIANNAEVLGKGFAAAIMAVPQVAVVLAIFDAIALALKKWGIVVEKPKVPDPRLDFGTVADTFGQRMGQAAGVNIPGWGRGPFRPERF